MRDHHCGESCAAAAVDGNPFALACSHPARRRRDRRLRSGNPAQRLPRLKLFRQQHDVSVRISHGDKFGEGAPALESGLVLRVADVLIAAVAFDAIAAACDEWHRDPPPDELREDIAADCHYDAGELVARHVGEMLDVRIVPAPAVPIATA